MYATGNPKTKKALREAVAAYNEAVANSDPADPHITVQPVEAFSPGPFPCPQNGSVSVEGPHYPKPHTWYANVQVEDGVIVKVIS